MKRTTYRDDYERYIWDFLVKRFLNQYAAAAIMGCMWCDSRLEPSNNVDEVVPTGEWKEFALNKTGFGLLNWTALEAKLSMYNLSKIKGIPFANLDFQLNFLWDDMNCLSYNKVVENLKNAEWISVAVEDFVDGYLEHNNNMSGMFSTHDRDVHAIHYLNKYSQGVNQSDYIGKYAKITANKPVKIKKAPLLVAKSIKSFALPESFFKILSTSKNREWYYVCDPERIGWIPSWCCEIFKEPGSVDHDGIAVSQ